MRTIPGAKSRNCSGTFPSNMLAFGIPATRAPEPTGFLLLEDGGYLLNEDGGRISLDAPPPPPLHGLAWQGSFVNDGSVRLYDVTYANGVYVAAGSQGVGSSVPVAFSSTDGLNWTQITFPFSFADGAFFTSVVYGAGNWVLAATTSTTSAVPTMLYISPNLTSWSSGDASLNAITSLAVKGSTFIATSRNALLFYSTTLSSWLPCLMGTRQLENNELAVSWYRKNLVVENGYFFALNHYAFGVSNYGLHRSADGITWERISVSVSGTARILTGLRFINGRYYGSASGLRPFYSTDLQTWELVSSDVISYTTNLLPVSYTDGTYLGIASVSGNGLLTSQDGLTFKARKPAGSPHAVSEKIIGANGRFVVLDVGPATGNPSIYTSL